MTGAANDVFERGQLLDADRPAGMQAPGGDADFRAHAEFAAVGELRRGVVQHDSAVEAGEEALGGGAVVGDDAIGVLRAISADVRDGAIDAVDASSRR